MFSCTRHLKSIAHFPISWTCETLYQWVKLYNDIKYFHTVVHAQAAVFFILITTFWLSNQIFWKYIKNECLNVVWGTFLDFADITSYLAFKISGSKRACTISLELKIPQTWLTLFLYVLCIFLSVITSLRLYNYIHVLCRNV